jgi:hypothetical protein
MKILLWALLGAVLGALLAFWGGEAYGRAARVSTFEGGYGMGVVFVLTPAGAVLGAVIGAAYGIVRWRRRRAASRT